MKLKKTAHKVIYPNQASFILNRNIHDYTRLIRSMIYYCELHKKNGYILFFDQEKTYNKIVHNYLWNTLKKYNFLSKFI